MTQNAVYPGTFDPITNGHVDLIARAAVLFPNLIVAVASNALKNPFFSLKQRIACVKSAVAHLSQVQVIGFDTLLVEFVAQQHAQFIIRGLRTGSDFEYEFQLAGMNRQLSPHIETLFLTPSVDCMFISSSLVRELALVGGDIIPFVPKSVVDAFVFAKKSNK